ncbi:MAG: ATP-binding protein [Actinomycetota bacterium]|nr:ATP-binding protein [Actinomycetota bacterium]
MRRRIVFAALTVAVAGILVLGIPLAVAARQVVRNDALRHLDRQADAVGFAIDDDIEAGRPVEVATLEHFAGTTQYVEVSDPAGRHTVAGRPVPGRSLTTMIRLIDGVTVRLTEPVKATNEQVFRAIAVVASFGLAGVLAATILALLVARRLTRPLDELAAASRRLGAGDFSVRVGRQGLPETDAVADALNDSAGHIERLVEAERQFSANASHQLRTPLTALRLRLEELANHDQATVSDEARAALAQADRLEATVDELLALARGRPSDDCQPADLRALVTTKAAGWTDTFERADRRLVAVDGPPVWADASPVALAQAVDALLENALRHGGGTVSIDARAHREHAELRVADEGGGIAPGQEEVIFTRHVSLEGGTGVGLALARALVDAQGGRVDLVQARPAVFRILLPAATGGTTGA